MRSQASPVPRTKTSSKSSSTPPAAARGHGRVCASQVAPLNSACAAATPRYASTTLTVRRNRPPRAAANTAAPSSAEKTGCRKGPVSSRPTAVARNIPNPEPRLLAAGEGLLEVAEVLDDAEAEADGSADEQTDACALDRELEGEHDGGGHLEQFLDGSRQHQREPARVGGRPAAQHVDEAVHRAGHQGRGESADARDDHQPGGGEPVLRPQPVGHRVQDGRSHRRGTGHQQVGREHRGAVVAGVRRDRGEEQAEADQPEPDEGAGAGDDPPAEAADPLARAAGTQGRLDDLQRVRVGGPVDAAPPAQEARVVRVAIPAGRCGPAGGRPRPGRRLRARRAGAAEGDGHRPSLRTPAGPRASPHPGHTASLCGPPVHGLRC